MSKTVESKTGFVVGRALWVSFAFAVVAVTVHGIWRTTLWGPFEPRVMEIAREQFAAGSFLRVATFNGVPFLEKPVLFYDMIAGIFHLVGGPSVLAARIVVSLFAGLWVTSVAITLRRAAGPWAALLGSGLLAIAPGFFRLCRRIQLDISLAAWLTLALLLLFYALETPGPRIRRGPWFACLVALGFACWTKGVFALFLFLAPTLAYVLLAREWRLLRAMLHPLSLLLLMAPHLLWAGLLYREGGGSFVFEHFVNNSIGRFLYIRFPLPWGEALPAGDVNSPQVWHYYLWKLPQFTGLAFVGAAGALVEGIRRRTRPETASDRLLWLGLCWGLVPPLILSFSSQKGVHHLGSCVSGFCLAAAIWIDQKLPADPGAPLPRFVKAPVIAALLSAPFLVVLAVTVCCPATKGGAAVLALILGGILVWAVIGTMVLHRWRVGLLAFLGIFMAFIALDFSPGNNLRDEARRSIDPFANWLAGEVSKRPVGIIGAGDSDLGAVAFALGRTLTRLEGVEETEAFFEENYNAWVVDASRSEDPLDQLLPPRGQGATLLATWKNRRSRLRLVGSDHPTISPRLSPRPASVE